MTPLVFLDTETTGVHPERQAWEIAMIRRDDTGERACQIFVSVDLSKADPFGLRIGGFYDRHPEGVSLTRPDDGPSRFPISPARAARRVAQWTHGAHIVGAVPNFDTETLAPLLRAHGLIPAWHYHLIDVEALTVGYLAGIGKPVTPPWNSDYLTAALGLDPVPEDERHTAMGDAKWAMRIYDRIMGGTE